MKRQVACLGQNLASRTEADAFHQLIISQPELFSAILARMF